LSDQTYALNTATSNLFLLNPKIQNPIISMPKTRFCYINHDNGKVTAGTRSYVMEIAKNQGGLLRAQVTSAMPDGAPGPSAWQGRERPSAGARTGRKPSGHMHDAAKRQIHDAAPVDLTAGFYRRIPQRWCSRLAAP
jgi:hypothetical protein